MWPTTAWWSDKVIMANAATLGGHVHVGAKAVLGGLCAVHQFARVGAYAFIGGKAGISLDIPPYMIATGTPAKLYGPNVIGLKRQGFSSEGRGQHRKGLQDHLALRQKAPGRHRGSPTMLPGIP
jgi:acyl-[acyl carrier protein]--UDP-N-acetylglucosamine O-acyltransferase